MAIPSRPEYGDQHARRVAVALTFDFDAESGWRADFGQRNIAAEARGTYGALEGVPRVLRLLDEYSLPATFFVPGYTAELHPRETQDIVAAGHEIGHHGYMHEAPNTLAIGPEREMLERGFGALESVAGVRPTGYRAPSWELSANTMSLLADYGITYDASQVARDRPYWVEVDSRPIDIVEVPSAWELTDSAHFLFAYAPTYLAGLAAPTKVEEIWREDFDGAYDEGGDVCFVLTMHPEVIGRHHRLRMLERVIRHILSRDAVWVASMAAIAADFRAAQQAGTSVPG